LGRTLNVTGGSTITRSNSGVTLDVVGDFDAGVKNTLTVRSEYDRDAGIEIANSQQKWNIWIDGAADDALQFTDNAGNLNIELKHGGSTDLFYSNSKKFETTSTGVSVAGDIIVSTGGTIGASSGIVTYYGDGQYLEGVSASGGGGDGSDFNTGLTTTAYASASDDIDGFTAIGVTFPTTADKRYLVTSMHITNVSPSDLYLTSRIDYNGGENVPLTNKVIVPYQGSLEIIDESFITNPSDNLRFAAFTGIGTTAGGVTNGLDCWVTYETKDDTNYIGIGSTVPTTGNHTVFTSNTNPSTINTINLTNYSNFVDVDASVSIYRGGTIRQGYLAYNLTIPQNSSVQILPRSKRLNASDTIVVNAGTGGAISVNIAGKYIT
jgi:hypothetical protein